VRPLGGRERVKQMDSNEEKTGRATSVIERQDLKITARPPPFPEERGLWKRE